jgi:general secretion pathway protein M
MKSYLNNLNDRERWMVIVTLVFMLLYAYYLFVYAPLSTNVKQRTAQLIEKKDTLTWMTKVRNLNKQTSTKKNLDNNQLLTLFANQLKNNQDLKFPYHLQQTSSGDIQLTFDEVPFNLFIRWLTKINDDYIFSVKQFDANNTDSPGIVRLMIMISAS